jgi:hypothetical protein
MPDGRRDFGLWMARAATNASIAAWGRVAASEQLVALSRAKGHSGASPGCKKVYTLYRRKDKKVNSGSCHVRRKQVWM